MDYFNADYRSVTRLLIKAQVKMVENTPMYKNEQNKGQIDQQRLPVKLGLGNEIIVSSHPHKSDHQAAMHPCTDTMHGPACPSSQTQIRPHLTCRHLNYMILLLFIILFFWKIVPCRDSKLGPHPEYQSNTPPTELFFIVLQNNPSQDSSVGSISAWYLGGPRFISARARIFQWK